MTLAKIGIALIFLMIIGFMVYRVWFKKPTVKKAPNVKGKKKVQKNPKVEDKQEFKIIIQFEEDKLIEVSDVLNKFFTTKYKEVVTNGNVKVEAVEENVFILKMESLELATITYDFFKKEIGNIAVLQKR